jgi:hypothetical protein
VRSKILWTALLLALVGTAQAKEQPPYQKGTLVQMESVPCGYAEKSGKNITGELLGTDSAHKKTQEMLCQEYVLEADRIVYRIRPKDDKHPVLLPVGESAEFRIHKDRLLLRVPEADGKEREYTVVSMVPRADAKDSKPVASGKRTQ